MKFAFALGFALTGVASAAVDLDDHSVPVKTRFAAFAKQFGKLYDTPDARDAAFAAFAENDLKIRDYNGRGLEYTLGHNEFSDLFADDFNAKMLGGYQEPARERNYDTSLSDPARVEAAADAKDWVTLGAVTPIKNQGQCGSCWAFSTVMGIEGDLFVEQGKLVSLSEQDLVSCDTGGVNQGCQGGLMDDAFQWVEANGICTEADYPYTSGTGTTGLCQKTCKPAVKVANYTDVPQEDEAALLTAVDQQPVSVAIEADKSVFQLYKSGVLRSPLCGKQLDHGVGIVGYGASEIGTKYWKVKNSWGPSWGMEGYILMERDVDQCGISQSASFPTGATQLQEPKPMTFIKR